MKSAIKAREYLGITSIDQLDQFHVCIESWGKDRVRGYYWWS